MQLEIRGLHDSCCKIHVNISYSKTARITELLKRFTAVSSLQIAFPSLVTIEH